MDYYAITKLSIGLKQLFIGDTNDNLMAEIK
jgi:hypothetical protein